MVAYSQNTMIDFNDELTVSDEWWSAAEIFNYCVEVKYGCPNMKKKSMRKVRSQY